METKQFNKAQRCRLILKQCLAIQLTKPGHTPEDFWMYDSGYMIFQVSRNFITAARKIKIQQDTLFIINNNYPVIIKIDEQQLPTMGTD